MFACYKKPSATPFPRIVALLMLGVVFTPAILLATRPIGSLAIFLGIAFGSLCAACAMLIWTSFSPLAVPALVPKNTDRGGKSKLRS